MDEDGIGALIGLVIMLAIIAFVIYCIVMLAGIIASVAGAGGLLWVAELQSQTTENHLRRIWSIAIAQLLENTYLWCLSRHWRRESHLSSSVSDF